jgi:hypothetical protein
MMTIDEFFAALEKTPRDWGIDWGLAKRTAVRRRGTFCYQCPLTAVAGFGDREGFWTYSDPRWWPDAARELGLRMKDARRIVAAADGCGSLRERLLAACGLPGPGP